MAMAPATTRDRLLADAEALVRTRGYAGFSYADLAARVGIRKASIHHHFPTKELLGGALVEEYRQRFRRSLAEISEAEVDAPGRLAAYGQIYVRAVAAGLGCLCGVLASDRAVLPDPLRDQVAAFFRDQLRWIEAVVTQGQRRGELRRGGTAAGIAAHLLGLLQGASCVALTLHDPAHLDAAIADFLRGLRPM